MRHIPGRRALTILDTSKDLVQSVEFPLGVRIMTNWLSARGSRNGGTQRSQAILASGFAAKICCQMGLLTLGIMTATSNAASVYPANSKFETGNLSGWYSDSNSAFVTTSYGAFKPVEGQYLGVVQSQGVTPHTISQSFSMNAGDMLSFSIGFQGGDYMPYDDSGFAKIAWGNNEENLFLSSISSVGNYGNSGWKRVQFVAPESNMYTLQIGVYDKYDTDYNSAVVIDSAPEPGTIALMALGMVGYGGLQYARRRKAT